MIGERLRRVDGTGKVTGHTLYADDLTFPGMLHAKILRSPHPHARIVSIDTSAAEALAGVRAVVTGADMPEPYCIHSVDARRDGPVRRQGALHRRWCRGGRGGR